MNNININKMKKIFTILFCLMLGFSAMAQQKIQLRSIDRAECVKSDMQSLKASFSFSTIEAQDYETNDRGTFSELVLPNTVIGGNEGDPQIPVINQLIAVPVGAQPTITVTSYSTTDYDLAEYGMKTLVPRQPSLRKDKNPDDVPFVKNEAAYQSTRGLKSEPTAVVSVEGTMRGVQLGKMSIEPVSYDPVNNKIRVFNDIEVEVSFNGADPKATEDLLVETYSPYFEVVYDALFNRDMVRTAYDDHPDLYQTPVKMLVVTTSTFTSSTAFQNWLTWKKQKGFEVDVQEVTSSTTAANVRSLIQSRYNANHPTFLVIVGDESAVKNYTTWTNSQLNYSPYISDNGYASIDSDVYHDMYMSRMAVENTTQLGYLVDKILMYEKYTMSDPSYLNNVLLIAGWDEPSYGSTSWTNIAGKPTINYAAENYFKTSNGYSNVYKYITTASNQTTCYNYINNVGFINYTAHGDIQEWSDPEFTNSNVNSLTNTGKPFWAIGNCCLTANWGNSSYKPCYGEAMIRANNKGAFGYIGSIPESYWFEDFYFGVGAFAAQQSTSNNPTVSSTTTGIYDAMFDETGFNCLNSVPYIGNVAVTYAHAANYNSSVSDEYYWRGYQTLGDGSVMPYLKVPAANTVSHAAALPIGATSFTVSADAGSYVSITVNNEIIGVMAVDNTGTVDVPITAQTTSGTAMIVVTRNQRQPYITTIPIQGVNSYTISTNVNLAAAGNVTGAGSYYNNEECTLTATVNHGYAFDNWTLNGNVVSTNPTYTFTVTADGTYTANFHALTEHHFTYNPQQSHGTISVSPTTAYAGDIVTLTATPEAGYRLDEWNVNTVNRGNVPVVNNQFTMPDSDVTISATFKLGYSITVADLIGGTIEASASTAQAGDRIRLNVRENTGYSFISWNVYETGNSSNTVTVTNDAFDMPAFDVTVSAVFGVPTQVEVESIVNVGSGTSTTNGNYVPTYSATRNANYSLTEQIYTASELGEAGKITAIEFYNAGSNARTRTLQIYMVHTTNSNFSSNTAWIKPTSSDMVYSGSVTFTRNAWTTVTFSTPFEYNGTSNVALIVDDNTGSSQSGISCYTYQGSSNQVIRIAGSTNYNPTSITSTASGRQANKNVLNVHITRTGTEIQPLVCDGPTNVNASNVTPESAVISWEGTNDSYNLRYREFSDNNFSYGFEDATPWAVDSFSPCTTYDGDQSATFTIQSIDFENSGYTGAFIAFQNGLGSNWTSHSGDMFGVCMGANGTANNDWFILPARTIEAGDIFSFWARSVTDTYGLERMKVGVYRGSGSFSSYLEGSASTYTEVPVDWTNYSYDLSSYAGQSIQLAINCVSDDAFALFIDDISITNPGGSWDVTVTDVTSPYTITGLDDEKVYEYQVVGVCDGIGESAGVGSSFSTLSWCSNPTPSGATNIAANSANLNWTGFQDSYNVQYRTAGGRETLLYEEFEDALPSDWATSGLGSSTGVNSGYFAFFRNGTTPQYLITPELNITESGCYYYISHVSYNTTTTIQIGYSSTTNATGSFTWGSTQTVSSGSSLTDYYEEIPTGTKYVALRVNSVASSSYYYLVDFVAVLGPYVEPGTWMPANNVTSGHQITGLDPETRYEWQVQGNCANGTTDWSTSAYFWTPSLCDTPDGLNTTEITSTSATLSWPMSLESYNLRYGIPETKFFYDFEEATPWVVDNFSPCTTYDGDGSATGAIQDVTFDNQNYTGSFIAFQNDVASGLNAHSGNAFGACMYATTPPNNDFFILPSLTIESGDVFSFWALGYASNYPESFKVGVYNGNGGLSSYLAGSASESITPTTKWQQYSYDLTAYAGQTIQLAINCVSSDAFIFAIDDIFVGNPHWGNTITCTAPYPLENLEPNTEYGWQVQGRNCSGSNNTEWSGTASFRTLCVIGATANPLAGGTIDGAGDYALNATATLTATPTTGYTFINWTENGEAVENAEATYSFTVTGNRNLVANFQLSTFEITATANPEEGGTVTGAGTYNQGATANLTAAPNAGYRFVNWTENGSIVSTSAELSFTVDAARTLVANFELVSYAITTSVNPANSGTVTGGGSYNYGGTATLEATPATGYSFVNWNDGNTENPRTITVTGAASYVANFELNSYTVTWMNEGEAIEIDENVPYGTMPSYDGATPVKASDAQYSYEFSGWTPEIAEVTGNATYTATYTETLRDYTITASANPTEGGTITGEGSYTYGAIATLTATANTGYDFVNWTKDGVDVSTETSYSFEVTGDATYVANFESTTDEIELEVVTFSSDNNGWNLIASPLEGWTNVSSVTNMTENEYDLYYFDQTEELEWVNYKAGEGNINPGFPLEPGKGYLYANSGVDNAETVTLTFRGVPYTGEGSVELIYVEGHALSGWNLIGNSWYNTAATIGERYFMRMNEDHTEIIAAKDPTIQPMEGIFVYTEDNGEMLQLTPSGSKARSTDERLVLNLSGSAGSVIDRVIVSFGESTLPKLMLDESHTKVYVPQEGGDYAVVNGTDANIIPVNFKAETMGTYKFSVSIDNTHISYLHLIDKVTGDDIDMLLDDTYEFVGTTTEREDRFELRLEYNSSASESDIFAYQSGDDIVVHGEGTLQVYDLLGRFVTSREINGVETIKAMPVGVYIFKLVGEYPKTQKLVVR